MERLAVETGIVDRSWWAFLAEGIGRSRGSELIENRDGDRLKQNAVVAMLRKIVESDVRQTGPRSAFLRKFLNEHGAL